jgi:prolipoprotein diacylglyceryltransferase
MLPVLISIGPITITTFGFFSALSFVVLSYFLWKSLKEDYLEEEILTFTIVLTIAALIGARIFYILSHLYNFGFNLSKYFNLSLYPGFSMLGGILAILGIIFYWVKNKSWNLWLILDEIIKALLFVLLISGLGYFLSSGTTFALGFMLISTIVLLISLIFGKYYRKFIWYKSGKPGFVGLSSFSLFAVLYLGLEIFFKKGIVWEEIGILVLGLYSLGYLYYRSERNLKDDLKDGINFFKNKISKKHE